MQDESIMERFGQYQTLVEDLTECYEFTTQHDIISAIITNDSSRLITVEMVSDEHYIVTQYCSDTFHKKYQ